MPGERALEIITGPGNIAQKKFENFSEEYGYNLEIRSREPGKLVMYLNGDNNQLLTSKEYYEAFLSRFLLLDERFHPYSDGEDTKWTVRIVDTTFGPCIEAFYL